MASLPTPEPWVTVIIPALNEERVIGKCLDALLATAFDPARYQVVVADNGSSDRTLDIVQSYRQRINVSIMTLPGVPVSALRNAAAECAAGVYLAFLDADCFVCREWFAAAEEASGRWPSAAMGLAYDSVENASWVCTTWDFHQHRAASGPVSYVPAGNLWVPRQQFLAVGGFSSELDTNEDYELALRLRARGIPVMAVPNLRAVHLGSPQTVSGFYRQQRWHGKDVFRVFLLHREKRANLKTLLIACYTLVFVIASLSLAGAIAWGLSPLWAGLAAGVFLGTFVLLAGREAIGRGRADLVLPLAFLLLLFALSRASALVGWNGRSRKRS